MTLEKLDFHTTLTSWCGVNAFSMLHDYRVTRVPKP